MAAHRVRCDYNKIIVAKAVSLMFGFVLRPSISKANAQHARASTEKPGTQAPCASCLQGKAVAVV